MLATVVIPTLNGARYLRATLASIEKQSLPDEQLFEVLIVDSGSTDATLQIAAQFAPRVRIVGIGTRDFNHGETRNLAARLAHGRFVAYLTQDATPAHDRWLANLLEPFFLNDRLGCVCGAQWPRPDACITVKREVTERFPGQKQAIGLDRGASLVDGTKTSSPHPFLSNANAAVRRDLLVDEIPFRRLAFSEDQALARDMQNRGYRTIYAPQAAVWHSNDLSIVGMWGRKRDEYLGLARALDVPIVDSELSLALGWIKPTLRDWTFLLRDHDYGPGTKLAEFIKAPAYNIVAKLARYTASRRRAREMV